MNKKKVFLKIRRNDTVIVLTGKYKGKIGIVQTIFSRENLAIISGINLKKKHQKSQPSINRIGGIIDIESKINLSNIAIFNKSTKKSDKICFKFLGKKKFRVFKSNGKFID